jgi:hypothetical protein
MADNSKNDRNINTFSVCDQPEEANTGSNYIVLLTLSEPNVVFTHIK